MASCFACQAGCWPRRIPSGFMPQLRWRYPRPSHQAWLGRSLTIRWWRWQSAREAGLASTRQASFFPNRDNSIRSGLNTSVSNKKSASNREKHAKKMSTLRTSRRNAVPVFLSRDGKIYVGYPTDGIAKARRFNLLAVRKVGTRGALADTDVNTSAPSPLPTRTEPAPPLRWLRSRKFATTTLRCSREFPASVSVAFSRPAPSCVGESIWGLLPRIRRPQ